MGRRGERVGGGGCSVIFKWRTVNREGKKKKIISWHVKTMVTVYVHHVHLKRGLGLLLDFCGGSRFLACAYLGGKFDDSFPDCVSYCFKWRSARAHQFSI